MLNIVLYQPDIPQNLGAVLRLSACLGCTVHVVEPCGFPFDHQKMRRVGMDYVDKATLVRHVNWEAFMAVFRNEGGESPFASSVPTPSVESSKLVSFRVTSGGDSHAVLRTDPTNYGGAQAVRSLSVSSPMSDDGAHAHLPPLKPKLYLLETDGVTSYTDIIYQRSDYVVLGRESAGTPRALYAQMNDTITIPMRSGSRSINLAMSAGLLVGEACRQMGWKF